jgi:hypothetical protein
MKNRQYVVNMKRTDLNSWEHETEFFHKLSNGANVIVVCLRSDTCGIFTINFLLNMTFSPKFLHLGTAPLPQQIEEADEHTFLDQLRRYHSRVQILISRKSNENLSKKSSLKRQN